MANDPTVRVSELEALAKELTAVAHPGMGEMAVRNWAAGAIRALIARAREEAKPGYPGDRTRQLYGIPPVAIPPASAGEPIVIGRASFAPPASSGTCADCGAPMNEGESRTFTVCDACWKKKYPKASAGTEGPGLREVAQEVWDSVPSTYDENDPTVKRHGAALNNLGKVLAALAEGEKR